MSNEHDPIDPEKQQVMDQCLKLIDEADDLVTTYHDLLTSTGQFPYYAHVSLGGGRRIARGAMNIEQINRRRLVIKQDEASSAENRWLDIAVKSLNGMPL